MEKMNYAKMSIKAMKEYIQANHSSDIKLMKEFATAANPYEEGGQTKYNTPAAKKVFYNALKDEIEFENVPKEKKKTTAETLLEWMNL